MIFAAIRIYTTITDLGSGQYSFRAFVSPSTNAKYLRQDDIIVDSTGNNYKVITWTQFPGDAVSGTYITAEYQGTTPVAPTLDVAYNSSLIKDDPILVQSPYGSKGAITAVSLYSGTNYEYTVQCTWNVVASANQAVVGDYIADVSGRVFEISYLDPVLKWDTDARIKEFSYDRQGAFPTIGAAVVYHPTTGYQLYSGELLEINHLHALNTRDNYLLDQALTTEIEVSQNSHSLLVDDAIKLESTGIYSKTQANTNANGNVIGYVTKVISNDSFKYRPVGQLVSFSNALPGNPGDVIYLDPTIPGELTATKPISPNVSVAVFKKIENTQGIIWTASSTPLNEFYDDLSGQIDGALEVFIVSAGNYVADSLVVSIGGVINDKGVHYFEEDPATGLIRFIIPPTIDDAPIIAQYQYLP